MKTRGSILLPSPFLCFINPFDQPLFSLLQCWTSHRRRPIGALGLPHFSSQAPPPLVLYISPITTFSRVYNVLPESQQAVYRESAREGGREGESARAEYRRDPRGQRCCWVSGFTSPQRDGLYNGPPGMPTSAPDRLWAGQSGPGGRWCQSSGCAVLSGASVAGHWRHGEVLVPLHLSLWNHLFGDRYSRNGGDIHL